ncbi:MAG: ASKHA domain-containing protein [Chloroflexota bacterium]
MPEVIHGTERRPLVAGRSLFEYADEVSAAVPASCQRTGRCRECVVEIKAGADQLSTRTTAEAYLPQGFRLACQARVEPGPGDVEFGILRRRMRILGPSEDVHTDIDPMVTVRDGIVHYGDMPVDRVKKMVLGLAVDIGTTTVVFQLIDLLTGKAVAGSAMENPQRFGGSDVMARISFERDRPGELRDALRRQLNHELRDIYARLGIDRSEVYEAVIVANTTMRDLFFGLDVTPIGESPYRSTTEHALREGRAQTTTISRLAHQVGLLVGPRARVIGAPLISGHVGADIAADLVALDFGSKPGYSLLVDIGTNTEVVLTDGQRWLAASCPAGPAFEGGLIRFGMPGADGAIEKVRMSGVGGPIAFDTIGEVAPTGICGSGLVDILAELRRTGWMSTEGKLRDGEMEIMVAPEQGISFSRADASQLAQAKAANACGQQILLRRMGITADQVDQVYLAGGFANAIDVENAIAIGMLADVRPERVIRAGNAALRGAEALLLSRRRREHLESIVRRIEHIELETDPDFFDLFVDGCQFHPIAA